MNFNLDRLEPVPSAPLPWLTPLILFLGLSGLGLLVMIGGTCVLLGTSGPLPPPRPPPPSAEKEIITSYRFKEGYYRSLIDDEAKKLGLQPMKLAALKRGNAFSAEFNGNQLLKPGTALETTHLQLKSLVTKVWVGEEGHGYRTEHLVLRITNKTDRHLAYQVITEVAGKCAGKGILAHNALALKPLEESQRTECLSRGSVTLKRVEVLELSPLGYHLISRLDPLRLRFDRRTSEGHQGLGESCKLLPWRAIENALQRGDARWYDVIDFYSRHSCDEYTFFVGYRWREQGPGQLPAHPPGTQ